MLSYENTPSMTIHSQKGEAQTLSHVPGALPSGAPSTFPLPPLAILPEASYAPHRVIPPHLLGILAHTRALFGWG